VRRDCELLGPLLDDLRGGAAEKNA
jgi:hypothetical protein